MNTKRINTDVVKSYTTIPGLHKHLIKFIYSVFKSTYSFALISHFAAPDECALNCLASNSGFYATLNQTVQDGTSCFRPTTASGKLAPIGTRGVCIDGHCKVGLCITFNANMSIIILNYALGKILVYNL